MNYKSQKKGVERAWMSRKTFSSSSYDNDKTVSFSPVVGYIYSKVVLWLEGGNTRLDRDATQPETEDEVSIEWYFKISLEGEYVWTKIGE